MQIKDIEKVRLKYYKEFRKNTMQIMSLVLLDTLFFYGGLAITHFSIIGVFIAVLPSLSVILFAKLARNYTKCNEHYKEDITKCKIKLLKHIVKKEFPKASYDLFCEFEDSRTFNTDQYNKIDRDDIISGIYDDYEFMTTEVFLYDEEYKPGYVGEYGEVSGYFVTKPKGIYRYLTVDLKEEFNFEIAIKDKKSKLKCNTNGLVKLDSNKLGKGFEVYAINEQAGQLFLDSVMTQKILKIKERVGTSILFTVCDECVNILFGTGKDDKFEFDIKKEINQEVYDQFKNDVIIIRDVLDILNAKEIVLPKVEIEEDDFTDVE